MIRWAHIYYISCKCAICDRTVAKTFFSMGRGRWLENIRGKNLDNIGSVEVQNISKKTQILAMPDLYYV